MCWSFSIAFFLRKGGCAPPTSCYVETSLLTHSTNSLILGKPGIFAFIPCHVRWTRWMVTKARAAALHTNNFSISIIYCLCIQFLYQYLKFEYYRMGKDSFYYLCDRLWPIMGRQGTRFQEAIIVEKHVAVTLWCLATCSEYHTINHLVGTWNTWHMLCYCK